MSQIIRAEEEEERCRSEEEEGEVRVRSGRTVNGSVRETKGLPGVDGGILDLSLSGPRPLRGEAAPLVAHAHQPREHFFSYSPWKTSSGETADAFSDPITTGKIRRAVNYCIPFLRANRKSAELGPTQELTSVKGF